MPEPLPISASVEVGAAPETVWAVISDVTRMGEWSPECRKVIVLGSPKQGVGTKLLGLNRRGRAVWPTTSRVVRYEPGKAVAWRTRESGATWTYELAPTDSGTLLTGGRRLRRFSAGTKLMAPLIGGAVGHDAELIEGMRTTLERIKAVAEAGAPVR